MSESDTLSKADQQQKFFQELDDAYTTKQLENPVIESQEPKGWLSTSLAPVTKGFRMATFNSPVIGAAATAALARLIGHRYGLDIDRVLSPRFGRGAGPYYLMDHSYRKRRKRFWGWSLAALAGLGFLGTQFSPKRKNYGLTSYAPMDSDSLQKKSSAPYDYLTLGESRQMILDNPTLDDRMKSNALSLLHSFDAPPSTPINGGSLVGQAIGTGMSAMTGAALGFLTANALGLPNPSSTAILGAVQNTLGTRAALGTSLIFGH